MFRLQKGGSWGFVENWLWLIGLMVSDHCCLQLCVVQWDTRLWCCRAVVGLCVVVWIRASVLSLCFLCSSNSLIMKRLFMQLQPAVTLSLMWWRPRSVPDNKRQLFDAGCAFGMDVCCRNPNRTAPVGEDGPRRADVLLCSRTNGWSWPPHPFQLLAWLLYIYFAVTGFGIFVPLLPAHWIPAGYIVSFHCVDRPPPHHW